MDSQGDRKTKQKNAILRAILNPWWAKDDSPLDVMG